MNELSWLIYLADVVPSLGGIAGFLAVVTGLGTIIWVVLNGIAKATNDGDASIFAMSLGFVPYLFAALVLINILAPSRNTIMFIAASEFGEEVSQSAEAQNIGGKAYKALDKFLSDYLDG